MSVIFDIYRDNVLVRRKTVQEVKGIVKIGTLPSSHLRLDHADVSRMHAVIEIVGDVVHGYEVYVIDLGSAHGTFVTSARAEVSGRPAKSINKQRLFNGDRVYIGPFTVLVYFDGAPETPLVAPLMEQVARYPEHEKLRALQAKNDVVARFLEWLETGGYVICTARHDGSYRQSAVAYEATHKTIEQWLAEHFGIDTQKIAAEKAAMYEALRKS